jgi:hypothetical protein
MTDPVTDDNTKINAGHLVRTIRHVEGSRIATVTFTYDHGVHAPATVQFHQEDGRNATKNLTTNGGNDLFTIDETQKNDDLYTIKRHREITSGWVHDTFTSSTSEETHTPGYSTTRPIDHTSRNVGEAERDRLTSNEIRQFLADNPQIVETLRGLPNPAKLDLSLTKLHGDQLNVDDIVPPAHGRPAGRSTGNTGRH